MIIYFKSQKKTDFRFPNSYKSPVIKRGRMKFNPPPAEDHRNEDVVVRTLENYVAHVKYKFNIHDHPKKPLSRP